MRTRARAWALALAALAALAAPARATTVAALDVEQLADLSDAVVLGRIVAVDVAEDEGSGLLVTTATVAVERTLKGAPHPTALFLQVGGRLGERELIVPGAPSFTAGERVVLFGSARGQAFLVTGFFQGKWSVGEDERGRQVAAQDPPDRDTHVLVRPGDAEPAPRVVPALPLEALLERVAERAARVPRAVRWRP